jgi:hypothetical protein
MLKKEFSKKDVNRMRNLITGKTDVSSEVQSGYQRQIKEYKEGDVWVEGKKTWTIKNGIKQTVSKLDKIKKEVFTPFCCPECGKVMKHYLDINNYKIHKKCHDCVVKFEHKLRIKKEYKEYVQNLKNKNNLSILNEVESYLLDAINNNSNSSYVSEQGEIERWVGGIDKKKLTTDIKQAAKNQRKILKEKLKDEKK